MIVRAERTENASALDNFLTFIQVFETDIRSVIFDSHEISFTERLQNKIQQLELESGELKDALTLRAQSAENELAEVRSELSQVHILATTQNQFCFRNGTLLRIAKLTSPAN